MKKIFLSFVLLIMLTGCEAYKNITYVQQAGQNAIYSDSIKSNSPDPSLKVGDLLIITVNATTPEAAIPFNLPLVPGG